MTGYVELLMDQGSNFRNVINIDDDVTNNVVNLSGYTITSQMRRSYYSVNPTANMICTVTDSANGELTLTLPADNTINIKAGSYVFDVKMINADNFTSRLLEGIIIVTPGVTQ